MVIFPQWCYLYPGKRVLLVSIKCAVVHDYFDCVDLSIVVRFCKSYKAPLLPSNIAIIFSVLIKRNIFTD